MSFIRNVARRGLRLLAAPVGLEVTHRAFYQHVYDGGYAEYRDVQILHNKRKLDHVFADKTTLRAIVHYLEPRTIQRGICHGARNGWEVAWLRDALNCDVIGTDISDTAAQFPNMITWDFHEENLEWARTFDFVYTNSLDQAFDPGRAVTAWTKQLAPGGLLFIEHTLLHADASKMDPFGANPMLMPYLLLDWGRAGGFRPTDIIHVQPTEKKGRVWVFVVEAQDIR